MTDKLHIVCLFVASIFIYNLLAQENIRFDNVNLPDNVNNKWMHDIFQDSRGIFGLQTGMV